MSGNFLSARSSSRPRRASSEPPLADAHQRQQGPAARPLGVPAEGMLDLLRQVVELVLAAGGVEDPADDAKSRGRRRPSS